MMIGRIVAVIVTADAVIGAAAGMVVTTPGKDIAGSLAISSRGTIATTVAALGLRTVADAGTLLVTARGAQWQL
jgi:hypothetical protein